MKIHTDENGEKYISHPYGGDVSVARAVISCFCPPHPKGGKSYKIGYKDGNPSNCYYKNLEWIPYHYSHASTASVKMRVNGLDLTVNKDGTIEMSGGKKMEVRDHFFDSDTDLEVCSSFPFVSIPRKNSIYGNYKSVDDLMKMAGFIQGDDADLSNPAILHRDYDYMNCNSDNLEWVEESDKRYLKFMEKKKIDIHNKVVKNNPGKTIPKDM